MNDTYSSTPGGDAGTGPSGATELTGTTGTSGMTTGTSGMSGTTSGSDQSTKDAAKTEARATGEQVKEGTKHVAEVGKEEAKNVARETGQQAKQLLNQTRSQLVDQTSQQQTRVAQGLRSLSDELSGMARGEKQEGMASDFAQQASQRIGDVASWLDQRDPGSLVNELKGFARQRPGVFLAAAAALGLVGGRLSRGLVADHQESNQGSGTDMGGTYATGTYPTGTYATGTTPTGTYAGTTGSGVGDVGVAGGYSAAGAGSPATTGAGADPLAPGTAAGAPTSGLTDPYGDIPDAGGSGGVR